MKTRKKGVRSGRPTSVYLSSELAEALDTVSFNERRTVTSLVEELLVAGMDASNFVEFKAAAFAYQEARAEM